MRLKNLNPEDVRALPNYTMLEAAHYLRIAPSTLQSWVTGRDYQVRSGLRRFHGLIDPAQRRPVLLLSFINLVEAHVLHAIRHVHGVKLRKVRSALDFVKRDSRQGHPLVTQEFETDGVDLFIERLGLLVVASEGGQFALREAFEVHLKRIRRDAEGLAAMLFPFTRPSHADQPQVVVIDPRLSFGRPVVAGSGVPTIAIVERYHAGEDIDHLATDFRLSSSQVQEAIRCETSRA